MDSEPIIPEQPHVPAFPEDTRIIYRKPDNGVAIVTPNAWCGLSLAEIIASSVPADAPYLVVDASSIPADRTFRAAWEWVG